MVICSHCYCRRGRGITVAWVADSIGCLWPWENVLLVVMLRWNCCAVACIDGPCCRCTVFVMEGTAGQKVYECTYVVCLCFAGHIDLALLLLEYVGCEHA